jgi:hypothetical protein
MTDAALDTLRKLAAGAPQNMPLLLKDVSA